MVATCSSISSGEDVLLSTVQEEDTAEVKEWIKTNGLPLTIAKVYYYNWSVRFQNAVESLLLERCVAKGFIKAEEASYILQRSKTSIRPSESLPRSHAGAEVLWTHLRVEEHFKTTASHRHFLQQAFHRLVNCAKVFDELDEEVVDALRCRCERHDLSKFLLEQAVGYTLHFVHGLDSEFWTRACNLHLLEEDHHPQHYFRRMRFDNNKPVFEQKGDSQTDSESMDEVARYESILDMVACRWERRLGGDMGVSTRRLVDIDEEKNYLARYCPRDSAFVLKVYEKIQNVDDDGDYNNV